MANVEKRTPATQFRFEKEILDDIDYLRERYGLSSRAEVIRHMTRRMAQEERRKEAKEANEVPEK